jgi:hypothetical protein
MGGFTTPTIGETMAAAETLDAQRYGVHDSAACSLTNGRGFRCTCDAFDTPPASARAGLRMGVVRITSEYEVVVKVAKGGRPLDADTVVAAARLVAVAPDLLSELVNAHALLRLALRHMSTEAQFGFAAASEAAGLGTEGATRHHERAAIIERATGGDL